MDDYSLENLLRMARILDAAAAIDEEPIALGAGATEPDGWRLSVEAPSIPPLEVRCGDRERGRRLLWTSVIELLTDRGLLGTQLWPAEFFSEEDEPPRVDPEYQKYRDAREQDAATLAALTSVLEHDESEETVQKFIEQRPHLWRFVSASPPFVLPKFAIGSKYVTDFTILGVRHWSQSQMRTATFVELERPSHRLFNMDFACALPM